MRKFLLCICLMLSGCATKTVCINSNDSFRAVLDPSKQCAVRIREVLIGSDVNLPRSISFKDSNTIWGYRWVNTVYKDGAIELGHFVLVPMGLDSN